MGIKKSNGQPLTITIFGVTLPVPDWARGAVGVLVLLGVAALIVVNLWPAIQASILPLITAQQANQQANREVSEYGRHMIDVPTTAWQDPDGVFTLRTFSDHCVLIVRRVGNQVLTKLIPDLTLEEEKSSAAVIPTKGPLDWPLAILHSIEPTLEAQGGCLNPHQGPFNTWYGARDGCWIQVWRQWPDGCTHRQMLNTCQGYWDSNPDGSPRVTWTACRH